MSEIQLFKDGRKGRDARVLVATDDPTNVRVFVRARDGFWYLQAPLVPDTYTPGSFYTTRITLGRDKFGLYKVIAVRVPGPLKGGVGFEKLPEGCSSNTLKYFVQTDFRGVEGESE